ncbi:hypothetical protein AURDEDRAFT_127752 [Auricularia subglabra TFB-10046 SS5]|nr:hypothetical protein AURDEDRAFT_127752 [Auricularia subglabra TFB-10046 SS5]
MLDREECALAVVRVLRLLQHLFIVLVTLEAVEIVRGNARSRSLILGTAGLVVLAIRLSRRRRLKHLLSIAISALSWTGHSIETTYRFVRFAQRMTLPKWMFLFASIAIVLVVAAYTLPPPYPRQQNPVTLSAALVFLNITAILLDQVPQAICGLISWRFSLYRPVVALTVVTIPFFLYGPMCALQDSIAAWRIRRAARRTPRLPPEIQLRIFDLLRTRARFGINEQLPREHKFLRPWRAIPFSAGRDLSAAARVCTSWHGPATEALYRDVSLLSVEDVIALGRTLAARPELALHVRRIVFPEFADYSPTEWNYPRTTYANFSSAVISILSLCTGVTDVLLFRDLMPLADIPGLREARHVRQVTIHAGPHRLAPRKYLTSTPDIEELDVGALLSNLPRLESLALNCQYVAFDTSTVNSAMVSSLARIHTLRLSACAAGSTQLIRLMRLLPRLRVADLRSLAFADSDPQTDIVHIFNAQLRTLAELTLLVPRKSRLLFGDFGSFTALRVLRVTADMLPAIRVVPSHLEALSVTLSPYSARMDLMIDFRTQLFFSVGAVRAFAHRAPPGMRSIALWDEVMLAHLPAWRIGAFMLYETFAPAGIDVAVNVFQPWLRLTSGAVSEEMKMRGKDSSRQLRTWQRRKRELSWRDKGGSSCKLLRSGTRLRYGGMASQDKI